MATDNKTVAEIVKQVRRECNSLPLPNAAGEKLKLVREIDAAHRRELAAKDEEIEMYRDELRATRERRDDCETKMRTALERVTHAESKCDALRALVKELADKLHSGNYCGTVYDACGISDICRNAGTCALIAKARKMIGGATL